MEMKFVMPRIFDVVGGSQKCLDRKSTVEMDVYMCPRLLSLLYSLHEGYAHGQTV